jgi:hypothetical protein
MDPISAAALTAVIAGLIKPAADEASMRMLGALKALLRRFSGAKPEAATVLEQLEAGTDDIDASSLAAALVSTASEDARFASELEKWVGEARAVINMGSVSNSNAGSVEGPLIQGRDFSGPITFK